MKAKKLFISVTTLAVSLLLLSACGQGKKETASTTKESSTEKSSATETTETSKADDVDLNSLDFPQLNTEVADDESLVEMVTSKGTIKIKLFPKIAPKAVENFVTHAKDGYFDNLIFHRVIDNFMIQGGDPDGTGMGGESIWKKPFEDEGSNQLYNLRGALSMANSGPDTNGSQFFIVNNSDDVSDGLLKSEYPDKIVEEYKKGGSPFLDSVYSGSDSLHTVFGQVIDGMNVVDDIAKVKVGENDKPKEDVTIKEVKVIKEAK